MERLEASEWYTVLYEAMQLMKAHPDPRRRNHLPDPSRRELLLKGNDRPYLVDLCERIGKRKGAGGTTQANSIDGRP
jgi:hypothetical protein